MATHKEKLLFIQRKNANFGSAQTSPRLITSKKDYKLYLEADRIANGWPRKTGLRDWLFPNRIRHFQKSLRAVEYRANVPSGIFGRLIKFWSLRKYRRLSLQLGFSIPINVFGPGLSIAHYGTIVVNEATRVGANCRLHTGVNIGSEAGHSDRAPRIGDNCYLGPGVKIFGAIRIADDVAVGANAVVNKSIEESGIAVGGIPAKKISEVNLRELIIPAAELARSGLNTDEFIGRPASEINRLLSERGMSL